jgi:thiamine-monophosphate kinase
VFALANSEFDIIKKFLATPNLNFLRDGVELGIGDDAAIIKPPPDQNLVFSLDVLASGVHFPADAKPDVIARRALGVNLSDLAAMAADPLCFTLGLTIPEIKEDWIEQFADGLSTLAREFNCPLVGGDLSSGPLQIAIQVHGLVPDGMATLRSGAQIGDSILVTGTLGDAAVALLGLGYESHLGSDFKLHGLADPQPLFERYFFPSPRVEFALGCRGLVNAAIDISDGFVSDLSHVLRESRLGAEIEEAALPFSATAEACLSESMLTQACLNGGDDYELCLMVSQDSKDKVFEVAKNCDLSLCEVGIIEEIDGVRLKKRDGKMVAVNGDGYKHF